MIFEIEIGGKKQRANIVERKGKFLVTIGDNPEEQIDAVFPEPGIVQFMRGGKSFEFRVSSLESHYSLDLEGKQIDVSVCDPRALRSRRGALGAEQGPQKITAPMPGKVVRIIAPVGTEVAQGEGVIVIEAMKMQNELKSPKAGKVAKIIVAENATVNAGDTLAVIE